LLKEELAKKLYEIFNRPVISLEYNVASATEYLLDHHHIIKKEGTECYEGELRFDNEEFYLGDIAMTGMPFIKDLEVMQFTGLTDRNDKEIYEGDILLLPNWKREYECAKCGYISQSDGIAKVIWANESYAGDRRYSLAQFRFETDMDDYELDDAEQYEVIGNIYENPELSSS